jgi:hypothetical protein
LSPPMASVGTTVAALPRWLGKVGHRLRQQGALGAQKAPSPPQLGSRGCDGRRRPLLGTKGSVLRPPWHERTAAGMVTACEVSEEGGAGAYQRCRRQEDGGAVVSQGCVGEKQAGRPPPGRRRWHPPRLWRPERLWLLFSSPLILSSPWRWRVLEKPLAATVWWRGARALRERLLIGGWRPWRSVDGGAGQGHV